MLACTVTPDDGEDTGTPVSTSVTITNSAPSITSVSMTPSSPQAGDTLTCSYTGYFDADGDADASTWSWTIDGVDAGESSDSLSSGFVGGELVVCTITPSDGTDDGAAVSASATIGNTAPTIDTVSISPSSAAVGDTLTCSYTGYDDPDGDPDESTASWTVNGTVVSTDWTLSSDFVGGDEVSCTVTPYDGKSTGTSLSDSLTIDNTPPSITSVTISPSAASTGDTLTCSYTGYADVDGDVDASGYSWTVNGTEVSTSSTLSSDFVGGDTVACTVTPDDGEDTGIALSDSLVVDNTAPSISSVSISPSTAQAADTLTCSYSGYSDPDGNSDQSTFAWTVNGSTVGNSATLSGAFIGHDEVTCTVTPSDGSDDGTALSASITIDNTAPVVSSVTISPSSATTSDALSCSHGGYSDADGDADVSTYAWSINGVTVSTDTTLSSGYVGGDTVTCTVTPDDGEDTGTAVSDSLTIDNTPPAITSVAISPSSASEGDTLTCSYSGFSDADGDSDQSTYSWTVNGTEVETSDTLSGSFVGGDTVACTVTPHDGEDAGTALSDSLTVDNTAPSITSVSISPSTAQAGDTLTCSYTGYVDPDGDTDQSTYSWTVDGTEVGTSDTLSSGFVHGETVTCTVTPSDGSDTGTALSDSLVVVNTAPSITSVSVSPTTAQVGDTLTCTYTGFSDADGETDQSSYAWSINGIDAGVSTDTLSTGFVGGDAVACTVTPHDGTDAGTALSDSVTIANTAPTITSVSISPTSASTGDTLTCSYSGFSDADGDGDASTYSWTVNGTEASTTSTLTSGFVGGDIVTCTVTPHDGEDAGSDVSDSLTIDNTAPSITSVSISPTSAAVGDTLSCSYSGYSDADGDSDASTILWTVGGTSVSTASTLSTDFVGGDTVTCTVTPNDGQDAGTSLSDSLVIDNTAPTITGVSIAPSAAQAGDTLTCSISGFSDPDGDADASTYAWDVNGTAVSTATTLSSGFVGGDTVTCTVTPSDGTDDGIADSASLVIDNTAPSITSVSISPSSPAVTDDLTCSYSGYSDADGDTDVSTYSWTVNGTGVGTTDTLASGSFASGDAVVCTVTPSDGQDTGTEASASVTIGNSAPSITAVSISPSTAQAGDTLTCSYSGYSDADGDTDQSTYRWTINGSTAGTSATLFSGFAGTDAVTCTVTPFDGNNTGTALSDSITISNSAPSVDSVSITPVSPVTGDTLACSYSGYDDPDGDADASTYAWTINGTSAGTGSTLGSGFVGGDTVTCTVTPSDGSDSGTAVSDSVVVDNTAPSITSVTISPSSAQAADTLSCSYSGYSDADGDTDASTYSWTVGGIEVGTSSTLAGAFVGSDVVVCTVTPSDGEDSGTALSDSLTIDNTAPVLADAAISPDPALTDDALTCVPGTATDADGDTITYSYAWSVDGSSTGETTDTLASTHFGRDQLVICTVTPTDGQDAGSAVDSGTLTISNTAPSVSSVTVSPASPDVGETLTCTYGGYSDADGDADASTYSWTILGVEVGTTSTLSTGYAKGDTVTCTVTPHDGDDAGTTVSDSVVIANSAPSISSVSISPSTAQAADELTCTYTGFSDPDSDLDQSTYEWTVNGSVAGASSTLSGAFFGSDTVTCTVTPSDGEDTGTAVSASVTIDNTAPVLASVSLTPTTAYEGDTLTCTEGTATDDDGDAITYSYSWTVDGIDTGTSGASLSSSHFDRGEVVVCSVTPSDPTADGSAVDSNSVTISNTAPVVSNVSISPSSPTVASTLTCTYTYSDADGDADSSTYSWSVGGTEVGTTSTLSTGFSGGDTAVCTVTPNDGTDAGTADSGSVIVDNTAPSITSVSISPTDPTDADDLTCSYSGFSDADGDADSSTYSWTISGTEVGTTDTLSSSATTAGDVVTCTVTPYDGTDAGTVKNDSATITASNPAPVVTSLVLSPSSVQTDDTLTVSYATSDADGDTVTVSYEWYVNGVLTSTTSTLSGSTDFDKNDSVFLDLTPNDGTEDGTTERSSTKIVQNTAPTGLVAAISPATPDGATEDIVCSVDTVPTDADGDTLTYTFTWDADGLVYPDDYASATGPDTTTETNDTIPAADTSFATEWTCTITPNDGDDDGTADDATATVGIDLSGGSAFTSETCTATMSDNAEYAQVFTVASGATVTHIGIGFDTGATGCDSCYFAIYDDDGSGQPGTVLGETNGDCSVSAGGSTEVAFSTPVTLPSGGDYYIGAVVGYGGSSCSTTDRDVPYDCSGSETVWTGQTFGGAFTDPWSTGGAFTIGQWAIWAIGY